MARTELLEEKPAARIARALGTRLQELGHKEAQLAESFRWWVLGRLESLSGTTRFRAELERTGRWHHQIAVPGRAGMIALSHQPAEDGEDWFVGGVFTAPLYVRIDEEIAWGDSHLDDEWEAKLIFLPSLAGHAFCYSSGEIDLLRVIDAPGRPELEGDIYTPAILQRRLEAAFAKGSGDEPPETSLEFRPVGFK